MLGDYLFHKRSHKEPYHAHHKRNLGCFRVMVPLAAFPGIGVVVIMGSCHCSKAFGSLWKEMDEAGRDEDPCREGIGVPARGRGRVSGSEMA